MRRQRKLFSALLTLLVTGTLIFFRDASPLVLAENALRDFLAAIGRKTPANPDLVFLAIDNDSVSITPNEDLSALFGVTDSNSEAGRALNLMAGGWPWSREVYALIIERLMGAGAAAVAFDLTFPTEGKGDAAFRAALERYSDRVVLGGNFVSSTTNSDSNAASFSRPSGTLLSQTTDQVGFVNFWPEIDEIVRGAQYRVTFEQVNGDFLPESGSEQFVSLAARAVAKAGHGDLVPRDLESRLIRFTGRPREGFPARSVFEIFAPRYWQLNYRSGEFFRGKIVLIGAAGNWQHDEHRTPFGIMPGPELQLNAMNALLKQSFLREAPASAGILLTAATGLLSALLWFGCRSPAWRLLGVAAINLAWFGVGLAGFNRWNLLIPFAAPLTAFNLNSLSALFHDLIFERIEKARVRRTLERYVSKNVVREMLDAPGSYLQTLGGATKPATILFSDIRGFSIAAALHEPAALVAQLNEYLTAMVDCVFAHGGTLDKFIGDAVMAVWGNARSGGPAHDAGQAVRCAFAMRRALARLNEKWRGEGRPVFEVGIGLNHGEVIAGNIGSPHRMEFTVIGDAVNLTWRLQEMTKDHSGSLLIGEALAALLGPEFAPAPIGVLPVGKHARAIQVFRVEER